MREGDRQFRGIDDIEDIGPGHITRVAFQINGSSVVEKVARIGKACGVSRREGTGKAHGSKVASACRGIQFDELGKRRGYVGVIIGDKVGTKRRRRCSVWLKHQSRRSCSVPGCRGWRGWCPVYEDQVRRCQ